MSNLEQSPQPDWTEQKKQYIYSRTYAQRIGLFGGILGLLGSGLAVADEKLKHTVATFNVEGLALASVVLTLYSLFMAINRVPVLEDRFQRLQDSTNNPNTNFRASRISRLAQKAIGYLATGTVLISAAFVDAPNLAAEANKAQGFIPGNKFLDSATVSPPYVVYANGSMGIIDECAFKPAPGDKVDEIDKNMFVSPSSPMAYKLPIGKGRSTGIEMQQLDEYSNGNDIFWTSGFSVQVLPGNTVKIFDPVNGGDLPVQPYTGPDNPSTTMNLPDDYYMSGNFSLLDYAIYNANGTFYLDAACDMHETNKLLAQFNAN